MRLSIFLALIVATFVAGISYTSAAPDLGRNLRAQQGIAGKADDIAAKFLQSTRMNAMLSRAKKLAEAGNTRKADILKDTAGAISRLNKGQKEKLSQMIVEMAKMQPEKLSQVAAGAAKKDPKQMWQLVGEVAKKDPQKLTQVVNEAAKKDPKKWTTLQVVLVVLATVGITFGATKLFSG